MMDCKKALKETGGDVAAAEIFLKKKGMASADKKREIEMGKEDLQGKPENIRAQIVEGRMAKLVKEKALLEQPYIIDTEKTVGEALKATVAKLGENMQVR